VKRWYPKVNINATGILKEKNFYELKNKYNKNISWQIKIGIIKLLFFITIWRKRCTKL